MRTAHRILAPLALAAVAACSDGPVAAPDGGGGPRLDVHAGGVQSATGSGHYFSGGEIRTFAFSAVRHADGSVSGQYQVNVHARQLSFHVDVTCMLVIGNTARIAGIISKSSDPLLVREGTISYFWLVDNGEGPDAPPDVVSTARINDVPEAAADFCGNGFTNLPPNNVIHGNVQVRA